RLAQVFANLLNNSAKFSEQGGRISLSAVPRTGNVEVVVSDNGIGIPFDMLNRVFETFTQVDKSSEKSQSGLGIGLSLAQQLVRMHGGTIEARSEGVGKGSQFFVRLPLSSSQPEETRSAQTDNGRATVSNGRRILVAEDHEDYATTLALMLQMLG